MYLGAPLEPLKKSTKYWEDVMDDLKERTSKWGGRDMSIFTRATFCNIFLTARVWYVLQLLHCARSSIQEMHRIFALFIWKCASEPMRRDNLFLRPSKGGLWLLHLFIQQVVSSFLALRDPQHPLLQVMFQTRLTSHILTFLVSSFIGPPARMVGFVKEVVEAFRFVSARFSLDYLASVSRTKRYRDLIYNVFPVPVYRVIYGNGPG